MRKFLLSIVHPKVTSHRELTIKGRKGKVRTEEVIPKRQYDLLSERHFPEKVTH